MKVKKSLNRKKNSLPQGTPFGYINCDISCQNNIDEFIHNITITIQMLYLMIPLKIE